MSCTQNVKGNRRIVVADCSSKQFFEIPDGLDLEDKTVVENWMVTWGKLYIHYVNGEKEEIDFEWEDNYGFKNPDFEIEDAVDDCHTQNMMKTIRKSLCQNMYIFIFIFIFIFFYIFFPPK